MAEKQDERNGLFKNFGALTKKLWSFQRISRREAGDKI